MVRRSTGDPTDGELEILQVLWNLGPSALGTICAEIRTTRPVATTTVATMLAVLLEKGLVEKTRGPRGFIWTARMTQQVAARSLVGRLLDRVFDGSAQSLVSHLLTDGRLSDADRAEVLRLLQEGADGEEPEGSHP